MKKISFHFLAIIAIGLIIAGLESKAATTGNVTATVTAQNVSVSLNQTSFNYGTVPLSSSSSTVPLFSGAGIVATNGGNVNSHLTISGANTTSAGSGWTLAGTIGADTYVHMFCNETANDCATPETNYTALTTGQSSLVSGLAASGEQAFQLHIKTPSSTTDYNEQSAVVTIQISAS